MILHTLIPNIEANDGWNAEDYRKKIIHFQGMRMYFMMRPVPRPHKPVHNVFMCKPGNSFHKEEGDNANGYVNNKCHSVNFDLNNS